MRRPFRCVVRPTLSGYGADLHRDSNRGRLRPFNFSSGIAYGSARVRRILIVDDEPSIAQILADFFAVEGYDVDVAAHGLEALEQVATARPHVVLLDVMMPLLDGPATLARLKGDPALEDIPVVMMSAARPPNDLEGYTAFVEKPFDMDRLLDLVERLVVAQAARILAKAGG